MKFRAKVIKTIVAAGLILSMTTGLAMASIGTGVVTGDSLRLRSEASTKGKILATVSKNTKVDVLEEMDNGWFKVSYNDIVGYMSGDWLSVTRTAPESQQGTVNSGPLNVRSGPATTFSVIGKLKNNTQLVILGETDGWYRILYRNQSDQAAVGYVSGDYITASAGPGPAAAN